MSDLGMGNLPFWYPPYWPGWWDYEREVLDGCEIVDYVLYPDGTRVYRLQNEAANAELQRRGGSDRWGTTVVSGDVAPYAIVWVNTCGGETIEKIADLGFSSWPENDAAPEANAFNRARLSQQGKHSRHGQRRLAAAARP